MIDGAAAAEFASTLESLTCLSNLRHVLLLNRGGGCVTSSPAGWSVKSVDLTTDDAAAIDGDLNRLTDETVIMLHAGVRLRPDAVERLLAAGGSGRLRNRARVRRTALTAVARGGDGGARAHSRGCVRQCRQRSH
jgi:hypothetical protein